MVRAIFPKQDKNTKTGQNNMTKIWRFWQGSRPVIDYDIRLRPKLDMTFWKQNVSRFRPVVPRHLLSDMTKM